MAIGSLNYSSNEVAVGLLQKYRYACGNWMLVGKEIEGERIDEWLGYSVSMSYNGEKLAFGAPPYYLSSHLSSGAATVYKNFFS